MSSNLPYKQAANVERRTWDKEAYEARAKARTEAADFSSAAGPSAAAAAAGDKRPQTASAGGGAATAAVNDEPEKEEFVPAAGGRAGPERSQRAYLKARTGKVDLEGKLGTSEIINPDAVAVSITDGVTKSSTGVGWHCKVCDCFLKDSMTYLDHINGRKHQRYLGYSMRVEKSTKDQVTGTLAALAEEKRREEVAASAKLSNNPAEEDDAGNEFEDAVKKKDEEALKRKADRARKREERKRREKEEREREEEELGGGLDPDMAAMMGFSGFGGGSKNG